MNTTLAEIASLVEGTLENGRPEHPITGVAAVSEAAAGQLTFFGNPRYLPALKTSQAAAALVPLDFAESIQPALVRVANPSLAFAKVLEKFAPAPVRYSPGIHPTAVIGEDVAIGAGVSIQPYAVVESGVVIGAGTVVGAHVFVGQDSGIGQNCLLHPHVTLRERSILGSRVTIHSGTVIGADGFGYEFSDGRHVKIPQIGYVQIDDDVEIGANVAIDRARFGRTWIQEGTKIDNLVQIAHNVIVGRHSILVSQTGVSGSSRLGDYVTLAGQVGITGHIQIGDRVTVGAQSGVSKNISPGEVWFGSPAVPLQKSKERLAYINRLEKLYARVKKLEQLLDAHQISSGPVS